jgi:hypothetical protein
MTNYDMTLGLADQNFQREIKVPPTLSRVVDFSKFTTTGVAGAAADTNDVLTIPAGFTVEDVFVTVLVPSTTSSSVFGVGDNSDSGFYIPNTTSATAAAGTVVKSSGVAGKFKDTTSAATLAASMSKTYTPAGTIRVLLGSTAPLNGKVRIDVRGFQLI